MMQKHFREKVRFFSPKAGRTFLHTLLCVLAVAGALFFANGAEAAEKVKIKDAGYAAKFISQSIADPVRIEAGEKKTIVIKFKNTGTAAWNGSGARFISAYTMEPRYRVSAFKGVNWIDNKQTAKISGTIKPGATGELLLQIAAPEKIGTYSEWFHLAAENYTWVKGGSFFIKFTVVPKTVENPDAVAPVAPSEKPVAYKPHRFVLAPETVSAKGGERVEVRVAYQNLGDAAWTSYGFTAGGQTRLATANIISFADELWEAPTVVFRRQKEIASGSVFGETLMMRAPKKAGSYMADFTLEINGAPQLDSGIKIPLTVTENAPDYVDGEDSGQLFVPRLVEEPRIRVGVWKAGEKDPVTGVIIGKAIFISSEDEYAIFTNNTPSGVLPANTEAAISYDGSTYTLSTNELALASPNFFRLAPVNNPRAVFTITNMERRLDWKGPRNFNKYRGGMELRATQDGKEVYFINDVLFEDYIAGIGETSAIAHPEYIKSLLTAARTYAFYIKEQTDKHDKRNFDVVAHTGDQLYLGVVSEEMMPRVVAAAKDTRGYMITYEKNIVVTPYFGNSDGRTRAWTEVWGGAHKPWLVPVEATYDKRDNKKMYGHGVGMAQRDAAYRAEDGMDWTSLVKYYYTGVEIEKMYE